MGPRSPEVGSSAIWASRSQMMSSRSPDLMTLSTLTAAAGQ
jgi:hypothetical protein